MAKRIYILLYFLFCLSWYANANKHRGVYFKSKEVNLENRTGLDLTKKGALSYENSFSIEFDISFRDLTILYGYIFQLKDKKGDNQIDLLCIDEDVFVVYNKNETKLKLGLSEKNKGFVNRWVSFKLNVNTTSGEIVMTYDGQTVKDKIDFRQSSKLYSTFGIVNRYGFNIDEVAPISVRDIRFMEDGVEKHHWPLNFSTKTYTKDLIGGKDAEIINPAWVEEKHQQWQKIKTLEFSQMPQIAFKQETEEVYFVQRKNNLTKYGLNSQEVSEISYNSSSPYYEDAQQAFFDKDGSLSVYSDYKNKATSFNENKQSWENSFDSIPVLSKYWHHNSLIHPNDGSFTAIGGYGYYTYYNSIRKLNEAENKWDTLLFKGDNFQPRYLASLGKSQSDTNLYYLYGGLGNATGKQILGKEFYYDLYKIDFEANYITKVWDFESDLSESYTPVNSMVVNEEERSFYTLCFSHSKSKTSLQLNKGSLDNPGWKFIGNKIPYSFVDITSFANLYRWKTHNKLLALTMHQRSDKIFEVNLYELNYPPSELIFNEAKQELEEVSLETYIVIGFILLLVLGMVVFWYSKRSAKPEILAKKVVLRETKKKPVTVITAKGKILTFGGFQVIDKNKTDITYRFSPTLKELFLLVLLNTLDENKGISSKKIQQYLWPDKPDVKAKNNRGVNIKKLRAILEDVGDISLSHDGSYWRISHGDDVFCDMEFIQEMLSMGIDETSDDEYEKLVSILSRGNFLINIESEWLDQLKDHITGRILANLEERGVLLDAKNDEKRLLRLADLLFTFDQMNERALELKCRILNHQGKHALALEVYNHYTKLYQKLYKEDFKVSFKDIVK